MDAEPARLIIEALKEEKIDLFVTLPVWDFFSVGLIGKQLNTQA